jgi:lysophospholipase L1-like esterase
MKTMLIAAFAACLAACGGGGSDPAPVQTKAACQETVTVQLYGDSTQWLAYQDGGLQAALDVRFGPGRVILIDQAVAGTTSVQLVEGTDGVNTPWPSTVAADIAIVNHGINDASHHTTLAQYEANLRRFAAGPARMVLETPNPVASWHTQNDAYAAVVRKVAAETGTPLADVQAYLLGVDWMALLNADGVHPSPEGQAAIAEKVTVPALAPIIASMLCR